MKFRATTSFRNAINEARRVFGCEDNSATQIVKRALRSYANAPFEYSIPRDKCLFATSMRIETDLTPKVVIGISIAYINIQIEKYNSRRSVPLQLDKCENYIEVKKWLRNV